MRVLKKEIWPHKVAVNVDGTMMKIDEIEAWLGEHYGAFKSGWCSEKNSHKEMDSDLAVAIFDEVEQQIKQKFGVE